MARLCMLFRVITSLICYTNTMFKLWIYFEDKNGNYTRLKLKSTQYWRRVVKVERGWDDGPVLNHMRFRNVFTAHVVGKKRFELITSLFIFISRNKCYFSAMGFFPKGLRVECKSFVISDDCEFELKDFRFWYSLWKVNGSWKWLLIYPVPR